MKLELVKEFRFEAAHQLPKVPPGHRCSRMHGHSFRVELTLVGAMDPETGWFIDFGVLDELVQPIVQRLDHHLLNEIEGLANPTSEVIAVWLWKHLRPMLPQLTAVTLWETPDARCTYRGE